MSRHTHVCTRCGWTYPEDVPLSPVLGAIHKGEVCGVCALQMVNAIHGMRRRHFGGSLAEHARASAAAARQSGAATRPAPEVTF